MRWTRDSWEVGRTQTDTNGCFAIDWDGAAGLHSLWARKDTWELRRDNLPIPAGGTNLGDVRLLESASFQGTLRAYDRSPVVAAVVEAVGTGPDLLRTNLAGGPMLAARTEGPLRSPGLVGEYYRVPEGIRDLDPSGILGNPMFRRVDAAIDFDAFFGEVAGSGLDDYVWLRWTGFLRIIRPGRYRFYLECDDGACLWIGGRKVVDNDRLHTRIEREGSLELEAGDHPIECRYFEATGAALCHLQWAFEDRPKSPVPAEALFHAPGAIPPPATLTQARQTFATKTSPTGRFRFAYLPPGEYEVHCHTGDGPQRLGPPERLRVSDDGPGAVAELVVQPFRKGRWRTWTTAEGLAQDEVRCLHFADDGTLWLATMGGVSHFDGQDFVNYTREDGLTDNRVFTLCERPEGGLWFGTAAGLSGFDGRQFTSLTTSNGLPAGEVMALARARGQGLWIRTREGLARLEGSRLQVLPDIPAITNRWKFQPLAVAADGALWFVPEDAGGLRHWQGGTVSSLTITNGLLSGQTDALHFDRQGRLWFGEYEWAARYDGTNFARLGLREGLQARNIQVIYEDPEGILWFGTQRDGVFRYDGRGFVNFTTRDGLAHNTVFDIATGPADSVWFATARGVSRYEPALFQHLNRADGLCGDEVRASCVDPDGALWFGTGDPALSEGGLCRIQGSSIRQFTRNDALLGDLVYDLFQDRDRRLWVANPNGGILRFDREQFTGWTPEDGLAGAIPLHLAQAPDGAIWIACLSEGLSRFDPRLRRPSRDAFARFSVAQTRHTTDIRRVLFDDRGLLWIGSGGSGVSTFDGKEFARPAGLAGLDRDVIRAILKDTDGTLWFGTENGAVHYDGTREERITTSRRRLANDRVNAFFRDSQGALWFGTDGGATRFDGALWSSLTLYDGLSGSVVRSILEHPAGVLWFGTDKGVTRYQPLPKPLPRPLVTVQAGEGSYGPTELALVPTGYFVQFRFKVVDYGAPPEGRFYRHRLFPGLLAPDAIKSELKLQSLTRAQAVQWRTNRTGQYTFAVEYVDRAANVSEPALAWIEIYRPWYRNFWLMGLGGVANVGLLAVAAAAIQRSRMRKHLAERLREQMLAQAQAARQAAEAARAQIETQNTALAESNRRAESLLVNVLPEVIAARLKRGEEDIVDHYEQVTVLFADLVGFTVWSRDLPPARMIRLLDEVFTTFDALAAQHGLEKIKTIGDAYMAVAGLPQPTPHHARFAALMALDMQAALSRMNRAGLPALQMRIGLSSGPVVAGIIGRNKFIYDLWGDTVNTASRMETYGLPGRIQVSEATARLLAGEFRLEPRVTLEIKGKGPMQAYFLEGRLERA